MHHFEIINGVFVLNRVRKITSTGVYASYRLVSWDDAVPGENNAGERLLMANSIPVLSTFVELLNGRTSGRITQNERGSGTFYRWIYP